MPKLGFNMNEGKLVKWYKREGDEVARGENLFSIETDKTNMEIEATADGVVRKLFIGEGDTLPVTLPIAIVGSKDEDISSLLADAEAQLDGTGLEVPSESQEVEGQPVAPAKPAPAPAEKRGRMMISPRARRAAAENGLSLDGITIEGTGYGGGVCEKDILDYLASNRIKVTPVAKVMTEKEGIDLESLTGTGGGGKIMKEDVEKAMAGSEKSGTQDAPVASEANFSADGKEILEEVPYAGVRKVIGDRLSESKFTAPHLYFTQKVNLEELLTLRKQVNAAQDTKTSVTDFIARATIIALQKYPDMNASLVNKKTIVKYKSVNLGIAVASPTGLIVPNLKEAQNMSVIQLAQISGPLFAKAREGKLSTEEYTGGTFTISNLGMFGIENFTAIINPPEVGILAISSTKDEPFVVTKEDGTKEVAVKPMMNIQLTVDHRVIDGLLAAQFVTEVKKLLENPVSLVI